MLKNVSVCLAMLVAIGGGTAVAASTAPSGCGSADHYQEINKKELTELVKTKKVFMVDANGVALYDEHHIPGAIRYGSFKDDQAFAAALPKDPNALIVAYCGGLQCTAWQQAAMAACQAHYTNVRHFKPGITGWMSGNQTLFDAKTRTASTK